MSFSIGIVGLPNVGKSTLFRALTKKQVDAANYPFCTIDPNVGVVSVPDERLDKLTEISSSEKTIPTTVEFVDIAGLVSGAHKGEGLGNQFLSHIREVDAIAQVVRVFENSDIIHVHGKVDPRDDVEIINMELIMADLDSVTKQREKLHKDLKSGKNKEAQAKADLLDRIKAHLEDSKLANSLEFTEDEYKIVKTMNLLTVKPFLYILNTSEEDIAHPVIPDFLADEVVVPVSAQIESELSELDAEDAQMYLEDLGLSQSGLDGIIRAAYKKLGLITYITTGKMETRAWTVTEGSKAPQAAGVIHTDFEDGFIRAEVVSYNDFISAGSEVAAKEAGLMRLEGKEYIVKDGDIMHFRFAN